MPTANIATELEQLKSEYEKQVAEKIKIAKDELFKKVTELRDLCKGLPDEVRSDFRASRDKAKVFREIAGLLVTPEPKDADKKANGKSNRRKNRRTRNVAPKVSDEQVLALLESEKTTGDIIKQFGFSSVTVSKLTKRLKGEGKITVRKDGVKKFWKKV